MEALTRPGNIPVDRIPAFALCAIDATGVRRTGTGGWHSPAARSEQGSHGGAACTRAARPVDAQLRGLG